MTNTHLKGDDPSQGQPNKFRGIKQFLL